MAELNEEFVKKFKQVVALREIVDDMSAGHFSADCDIIAVFKGNEFFYLANALECLISKTNMEGKGYNTKFHYCFKYGRYKVMYYTDEDLEVNV